MVFISDWWVTSENSRILGDFTINFFSVVQKAPSSAGAEEEEASSLFKGAFFGWGWCEQTYVAMSECWRKKSGFFIRAKSVWWVLLLLRVSDFFAGRRRSLGIWSKWTDDLGTHSEYRTDSHWIRTCSSLRFWLMACTSCDSSTPSMSQAWWWVFPTETHTDSLFEPSFLFLSRRSRRNESAYNLSWCVARVLLPLCDSERLVRNYRMWGLKYWCRSTRGSGGCGTMGKLSLLQSARSPCSIRFWSPFTVYNGVSPPGQ